MPYSLTNVVTCLWFAQTFIDREFRVLAWLSVVIMSTHEPVWEYAPYDVMRVEALRTIFTQHLEQFLPTVNSEKRLESQTFAGSRSRFTEAFRYG
jgi:hypothetical protein